MDARQLNLREVVPDTCELLGRLLGDEVTLNTSVEADLWPICMDLSQFEQVLTNLVVNARDAMPGGGQLTIRARNHRLAHSERFGPDTAPPGQYVGIMVGDTGLGMAAEVQQKIFEPFFSTKVEKSGTGLGLSTTYGNVRSAGGFIEVVSAPGKGTTFLILLPRGTGEERASETPTGKPGAARGETILLVENEDSVRSIARMVLEEAGYRPVEARNGREALEIMDRDDLRPALLVCDGTMPGMSGIELAEEVRKQRGEIPLVLISGYGVTLEGTEVSNASFIQKPFGRDEFLMTIEARLASGSAPPSPGS